MSIKKPWFPFYAADFDADTQHFTPTEIGIYLRLLIFQWQNPEGLPTDQADLARIARAETHDWVSAWGPRLIAKFQTNEAGLLYNKRLHQEWLRANKISEGARVAGLASGQARKKDSGNSDKEHPFPIRSTDGATESNHPQSQSQLQLGEERAAPRPTAKRKHRLPKDWQPSPKLLAWAKKEAPAVNISEETKIFRDHFLGSGNPKVDWDRTWQVWMRKEQKASHQAKRKARWTFKMAEDFCIREHLTRPVGESTDAFIDRMRSRSEQGPRR